MANLKLGILGAGQLARMLALSGSPLGLRVRVLAANSAEPAAQVSGDVTIGSLTDESALKKFADGLDAITFESEFVDTDLLRRSLPASVRLFPSLEAIERIQDRLTQKQLLTDARIPTSPWMKVNSLNDLETAHSRFSQGYVLKQRRFGYDGYGTFVFREGAPLDAGVLNKSKFGFIAEEFVPFKRELAISFVRSSDGKFLALPLVESVQRDSRCFSVCGPVKHAGVAKLTASFKKLMQQIDYLGILAVELFDTGKQLLVNELAPRVHNSAHYSQNALQCDQFEYHLRAGLGMPLPPVEMLRPGFAMVNLLGEGGSEIHLSPSIAGKLHWYGKSENREGRKLGHINTLDKNPKSALKRALKWRKEFKL